MRDFFKRIDSNSTRSFRIIILSFAVMILTGALLLMLYQFTHLLYYALPGLICVLLAAASRCMPEEEPFF